MAYKSEYISQLISCLGQICHFTSRLGARHWALRGPLLHNYYVLKDLNNPAAVKLVNFSENEDDYNSHISLRICNAYAGSVSRTTGSIEHILVHGVYLLS